VNHENLVLIEKSIQAVDSLRLELESCCFDYQGRVAVRQTARGLQLTVSWFELVEELGSIELAAENCFLGLLARTPDPDLRGVVLCAAREVFCRRYALRRLNEETRRRNIELNEVVVVALEKLYKSHFEYKGAIKFRALISKAISSAIADLWRQNPPNIPLADASHLFSADSVADSAIADIIRDDQRCKLEIAMSRAKHHLLATHCTKWEWSWFTQRYVLSKPLVEIARHYEARTGKAVSLSTVYNKVREILNVVSIEVNANANLTIDAVVALLYENDRLSVLNAEAIEQILRDGNWLNSVPSRKRGRPRKLDA